MSSEANADPARTGSRVSFADGTLLSPSSGKQPRGGKCASVEITVYNDSDNNNIAVTYCPISSSVADFEKAAAEAKCMFKGLTWTEYMPYQYKLQLRSGSSFFPTFDQLLTENVRESLDFGVKGLKICPEKTSLSVSDFETLQTSLGETVTLTLDGESGSVVWQDGRGVREEGRWDNPGAWWKNLDSNRPPSVLFLRSSICRARGGGYD